MRSELIDTGPNRNGFALVIVLLTLITLGLLVSGLLYISTEEVWITRGTEELLRTRLAAESAVRSELARWKTADYRELPVGTRRGVATVEEGVRATGMTTSTIERLDGPLFLLLALSTAPSGTRASAAAVVRTIDPLELWRELSATLSTTGQIDTRNDEALAGFTPEPDPTGDEPACHATALPTLIDAFGTAERPSSFILPPERAETLRFGPLDAGTLRLAADRVESGTITPRPITGEDGCTRTAHANWGAPRQTGSPCIDFVPLIFAPNGLRLEGGQGQGILVVTGELILSGDAEFHGVVLVQGHLRLTDQARIHGAAIITGPAASTIITGDARMIYDPCAIDLAIKGAQVANRPYHPGDRGWIPSF